MKIRISGDDFNSIMKTCIPAIADDSARLTLNHICIDCDGKGHGCATALDGFVLAQVKFPCAGDAGRILVFPCKPVKYVDLVDISNEDNRTTVSYGDYSFSRRMPSTNACVDYVKITRDAQSNKKCIRIAFSPALMAKVLKSHKQGARDPIYMDIYGNSKPILVYSRNTAGVLLPYKVNCDVELPEFWTGEEGEKADANS